MGKDRKKLVSDIFTLSHKTTFTDSLSPGKSLLQCKTNIFRTKVNA